MPKKGALKYEVEKQGTQTVIIIDYNSVPKIPSIENDPLCMASVIDILVENPEASKIIFLQKREYEYDEEQVSLLSEVAKAYKILYSHRKNLSYTYLLKAYQRRIASRKFLEIQKLFVDTFKKDPFLAYMGLKKIIRYELINLDMETSKDKLEARRKLVNYLQQILQIFESLRLIQIIKSLKIEYRPGDREVYRQIFTPIIRPDFIYTKLMNTYPKGAEEIDNYTLKDGTEIVVFKLKNSVHQLYFITPPEFNVDDEKYELIDMARNILVEHQPTKEETLNPEKLREVFKNISSDLLQDLANYRGIKLTSLELEKLSNILVRYTIGFGIIENILMDEKIQDVSVNSPPGLVPIFVVHQDHGDCKTNIIPTLNDLENWASKLRLISGRALDSSNPVLDTELIIPGVARARVAAVTKPLSPLGYAYVFRRHRDRPWTLPLFMKYRMLNPIAAGVLSFLVDGARTMLIAGTRSAGKTSLLTALMIEIMRRYRIITIEDTLEFPHESLRQLGYNIQPLKVASALSSSETELSAEAGLRTTLRLGDSCLIVGEVRSKEALALYEAMRVGALANVVAGTIHGDSPYGVFDRVVNDLGVPRTSFKATDIIVVANPIRSPDGLKKWRRVIQITEVRKHWEQDPMEEHGFVDLLRYDAESDELQPTQELLNGDSEIIKSIASNVREWVGDWDAIWDNILLRAQIKQEILNAYNKTKLPEVLEAEFVVRANDMFHLITDKVKLEHGEIDSKQVLFEWKEWLNNELKLMMKRL